MDITKIVDKTKISEAHVGAASSAKTKGVKSETVDANNASSKAASMKRKRLPTCVLRKSLC